MKKALFVGINHYKKKPLLSCINDAEAMRELLNRHEEGERNFDCELLCSDESQEKNVTHEALSLHVRKLFQGEGDMALFYFSGHGAKTPTGLSLVTQDGSLGREGFPVAELITLANHATQWRDIVIILDCCYSGSAAEFNAQVNSNIAVLRKGVSILSAALGDQHAKERGEHGVFTRLLLSALEGDAADLLGSVSVASVYNYADQMLQAWDQRPVFKTHVNKTSILRKCKPSITLQRLQQGLSLFEAEDAAYQLDPQHEPTVPEATEEKKANFKLLQDFRDQGLAIQQDAPNFYEAAINSKTIILTRRGRVYWTLHKDESI